MALDTNALTDIATLAAYLESPTRGAITIHHDETASATAATVEVTATAVVLIITGGGNAGTDTLTLSDAANDTLGELVNVINALGKGWVASIDGSSGASSTDLVLFAQTSVFGSSNAVELQIRDEFLMEHSINAATAHCEKITHRRLKSRAYTEWIDGRDRQALNLAEWPVTVVNRISVGRRTGLTVTNTSSGTTTMALVSVTTAAVVCKRTTSGVSTTDGTLTFASNATITAMKVAIDALGNGWSATITSSLDNEPSADLAPLAGSYCLGVNVNLELPTIPMNDYRLDEDAGIVYMGTFRSGGDPSFFASDSFRSERLGVFVDYTAGYDLTTLAGKAVEQICLNLAAAIFNGASLDESLVKEKLGDYSFERGGESGVIQSSLDKAKASLSPYIRKFANVP